MEKETLITLDAFKVCDTKEELRNFLFRFLKQEGSIYFEHGYSEPAFIINKFGYVTLYAVTSEGDVRFSVPNKCSGLVKIEELSFAQLQRLIYICNDYYLYCKYEA